MKFDEFVRRGQAAQAAVDALTHPMPKNITIGDKYAPAMLITEQAEADAYFEHCVAHSMTCFGQSREDAERVERDNLGYFAGYSSHDVRARVERLFRCAHPIFGAIAENGPPTAEEAFNKGRELGEAARKRSTP